MSAQNTNKRAPLWTVRLGEVSLALVRNRYALRRTARRVGDQRLAQRLRRFARRRQAAATDLERMTPDVDAVTAGEPVSAVPGLRGQAQRAFETSAVAAAIAANRKLRVAVERTLEADPPQRVRSRLEVLRQDADREASVLNARFAELTAAAPEQGTTGGIGDRA